MNPWNRNSLRFILLVLFLIGLGIWMTMDNTSLEIMEYTIVSDALPQGFSGFRIAQISDLHNTELGKNNSKLLSILAEVDPDIIVITGDLIDSRRTDLKIALEFTSQAYQIAPVYYVTGNHEARVPEYEKLKNGLSEAGVVILDDEKIRIEANGEYLTLMGIKDPSFTVDYLSEDAAAVAIAKLNDLRNASDGYTILLSHRPELFETYVGCEMDLVLTGHAHGGQFRLPLIGGLFAPNQGFFPKYDAGIFSEGETSMIVSRGIGNSIIPFRINNRPEIVLVNLES